MRLNFKLLSCLERPLFPREPQLTGSPHRRPVKEKILKILKKLS